MVGCASMSSRRLGKIPTITARRASSGHHPKRAGDHLQAQARQSTIGQLVDDAMAGIERDNAALKGVLPKDYARTGELAVRATQLNWTTSFSWGFLRREVLPHAADAWYVSESVKIGYEVSFTRDFCKPKSLWTLAEVRADILALEKETEGLLGDIIGVSAT